jgi:hypothetical protein
MAMTFNGKDSHFPYSTPPRKAYQNRERRRDGEGKYSISSLKKVSKFF